MFDEQGDHGRLSALAALLGAVDRTPYSSHFAGVRHAKTSKRFDEPLSVPLKDEILPSPYDDGTHSICHAIGYSHFEQRGRWIASRMNTPLVAGETETVYATFPTAVSMCLHPGQTKVSSS